ncbi:hypothetical protein MNB_ARC-1_371 [hydrothermal vent metagenome]|uniref:FxsA protein n=1 Tax=hydrothermal vent metagenome TaxID=652676 RepID=A0A3B1E517_9ZZZZ
MIYFLVYLLVEVIISSAIVNIIGGLLTFTEIILSIAFGVTILKNLSFSLSEQINVARNKNILPEELLKSNTSKIVGSILLIIPGFFTDILGIILQFSLFAIVLTKIFKLKTKNMKEYNSMYSQTCKTYKNINSKGDEDVIDIEIIDSNKHIKH